MRSVNVPAEGEVECSKVTYSLALLIEYAEYAGWKGIRVEAREGRNESFEIYRQTECWCATENRVQQLPLSGGGTKSIDRAWRSWSGGITESSLSLRNNLGWCLNSCLQLMRLMKLFICRGDWGCGTYTDREDPSAVGLKCISGYKL